MDPIEQLRKVFNEFKAPYLSEHNGQDVEEVNDVAKHMDTLYQIVIEVINNNGKVPEISDTTKKAIYSVFEKRGIFAALRADPSLKEEMARYAALDLRTYPYSFKAHINELSRNSVSPEGVEIIPNTE